MSVAVVTTCFNEAEWIEDAIHSVLDQTVPPAQHIVVNDGSSDASAEILSRFDHLTVLEVTNRGMPAARTAGLLALQPAVEWVVYLDGDDWLEPNFIEECSRIAAANETFPLDVVFPKRVKHPGSSIPALPLVLHPSERQLWEACHGFSCAMIRRGLLVEAGGFHPATGGDCDWDFWIDAARRGARFAYAGTTHYHYRVRPDSYSRTVAEELQPVHVEEMRRHHV